MTPYDVRIIRKVDLDGLTVNSTEAGLPGPHRNLIWTVVQDDASGFAVHALWDVANMDVAMEAALEQAPGHYGHDLTTGIFAATDGDIADAKYGTYPELMDVSDVEAALSDPELVRLVVQ